MKNVLVTGGRGFIGFNAIQLWTKIRPDYRFVCIDADTYADRFLADRKNRWLDMMNIPRFVLDLGAENAQKDVLDMLETFDIDTVCHFGAESHVDNSLSGPEIFFRSNVTGTVNLLEAVRKWRPGIRFHYVSTDEVYGITRPESQITTDSPFRPSSPYSSSKAAADLIVQSYRKSFDLNVTISRCSNNFGPWQQSEKFIPTIIRKLLDHERIPIYGDGSQCRQWIHVDDHNRAILDILEGEDGVVANVSSNMFGYMKNIDLVALFAELYGRKLDYVAAYVKDRKAHDTSYYIPNYRNLDYSEEHIRRKLADTFAWYSVNI